jgi:hypothetical protein
LDELRIARSTNANHGITFTDGVGGGGPGWKCRQTPAPKQKQKRLKQISRAPLAAHQARGQQMKMAPWGHLRELPELEKAQQRSDFLITTVPSGMRFLVVTSVQPRLRRPSV